MSLLTDVMKKCEAGTARESMAARCLRDQKSLGFSELELAFAVTAPFGAGIETVSAHSFGEVAILGVAHTMIPLRRPRRRLNSVYVRMSLLIDLLKAL